MELRFLFDTNAVINLFRENKSLYGIKYYFSIITELELLFYVNITKEEKLFLKEFCNENGRINVNNYLISDIVIVRMEHNLKLPDAIICGTALRYKLTLVTDDIKLQKVNGLDVLSFKNLLKKVT